MSCIGHAIVEACWLARPFGIVCKYSDSEQHRFQYADNVLTATMVLSFGICHDVQCSQWKHVRRWFFRSNHQTVTLET